MSAAEKFASGPAPPIARVVAFNRVSEENYFALDLTAPGRHEYLNGEVVAMAGASPNHNDITLRVGAFLLGRLPKGCATRVNDQRVYVPARRSYVYPDVVVTCGPRHYQPGTRPPTLLNPVLIVEVLSESTAVYDLTRKFQTYQTIPGLLAYLLLDSQQISTLLYTRELGSLNWTLQTTDELTAVLPLTAIGIELPLAEAYAGIEFGEGEDTFDVPPMK